MQGNSQDGPGDRKLNEGDRSGEDVDLVAIPRLSRAGARRHVSVHGESVERRVWGKAKPWRAHVRHGKGKGAFLRSQEQRGPGRTRNAVLRKERGRGVKCKPGVQNDHDS